MCFLIVVMEYPNERGWWDWSERENALVGLGLACRKTLCIHQIGFTIDWSPLPIALSQPIMFTASLCFHSLSIILSLFQQVIVLSTCTPEFVGDLWIAILLFYIHTIYIHMLLCTDTLCSLCPSALRLTAVVLFEVKTSFFFKGIKNIPCIF